MHLKLIEPLRELFKDEVRELGVALGIDAESVWRHPFPGPGLAIRVLGEITRERLAILREADDIMIQVCLLWQFVECRMVLCHITVGTLHVWYPTFISPL